MSETISKLYIQMYTQLSALRLRLSEERGQTMVEYGVILGVIVVGAVIALTATNLGSNIATFFHNTGAAVPTPTTTVG